MRYHPLMGGEQSNFGKSVDIRYIVINALSNFFHPMVLDVVEQKKPLSNKGSELSQRLYTQSATETPYLRFYKAQSMLVLPVPDDQCKTQQPMVSSSKALPDTVRSFYARPAGPFEEVILLSLTQRGHENIRIYVGSLYRSTIKSSLWAWLNVDTKAFEFISAACGGALWNMCRISNPPVSAVRSRPRDACWKDVYCRRLYIYIRNL